MIFFSILAKIFYIMESPYIDIHSHNKISHNHLGIQNFYVQDIETDIVFPDTFSLGLHPWHISKSNMKSSLQMLESLSDNPQLAAIGECGLDRAISVNFDLQKEAFLFQLQLAEKQDKALIVHSVRAFSDFLSILKQEKPNIPLIFHAYTGNHDILKKLFMFILL